MNDFIGYDESDLQDIPSMINKLIENKINLINTSFIAEVTAIKENRVSVVNVNKYVFGNEVKEYPIINNVLVAMPATKNNALNLPISIGDKGLCIVLQSDITNYKNTGNSSIPNSARRFDIADSIFLPLSLYIQENIKEKQLDIKNEQNLFSMSEDGITMNTQKELNFSCDNLVINAKEPLEIGNSTGTLLSVINDLITMMDALAEGLKGGASNPSAYKGIRDTMLQKIKEVIK